MRILTIITEGEYGRRHLENIQRQKPEAWQIEVWTAPSTFPLIIDYPEDYLPDRFESADLILSFAEHKGVAELLPDVAKMTRAKAVIAAVDNEVWLPRGLARQLVGWLERMNVACATPKPLCSLTQTDYKVTRKERVSYESPHISEFARYFGQPALYIEVDEDSGRLRSASTITDAVCGCARHVAAEIIGMDVGEVEEKAGLLHHHYPCLASMVKLNDYNHDTLMHESAHLLVDNIREQIKPYKKVQYLRPGKLSE
jgi:hypothetical protein